jgi:ABC-type multidrug transport system ATPase subunit/pSer/pThr/pTyr-binding forkhead associated (FHA) protein
MVVGRDPGCDVPLADSRVSWRHLQVELRAGTPLLTDLGSSNGTHVDGTRAIDDELLITHETIVQVGSTRARIRERVTEPGANRGRFRRVTVRQEVIRIGRAPDNDIVLDEPNISWLHAEVRPGDPPTLIDTGSRNGVRLGNALLQGGGILGPGVLAGIGPFSLRYQNGEIVVADERAGLSLRAMDVSVEIGGATLLRPTSLSVSPGELLALIGPSGSGKTTLLKCLAGVAQPTAGEVQIGLDALALRLTDVGYVPQSDVVHGALTVREALTYAARLRLPSDTRKSELTAAVDAVIAELRLTDHGDTRTAKLSGGQRKRVACGVELIGKPTMLLLDEPTSGLDPALERRLMLTLRRLADSGRGVVVVTHATSSLALCDTVAVMGPGGNLLLAGSPRESLEHFEVPAYDEIYSAIELVDLSRAPVGAVRVVRPRTRARLLSGRSLAKHTRALLARYGRTFSRDQRTLSILLGQAPLIGLLIALLYPSHLLAFPDHEPARSAQFAFLLVTAAVWLGLIDSCREIVRERSIIMRELVVGVRLDAYLLSKAILLFALSATQCVLLVAVATVIQPLHAGVGAYLALTCLLVVASWSTVAIGLVVSTLARSVDQATSLIPLLLIPELLFGAALVPFARMGPVIKGLSDLMVSRWAFAGVGHVISMGNRLSHAGGAMTGYEPSFFSASDAVTVTITCGFTAAMLLVAAVLLARQSRRSN